MPHMNRHSNSFNTMSYSFPKKSTAIGMEKPSNQSKSRTKPYKLKKENHGALHLALSNTSDHWMNHYIEEKVDRCKD